VTDPLNLPPATINGLVGLLKDACPYEPFEEQTWGRIASWLLKWGRTGSLGREDMGEIRGTIKALYGTQGLDIFDDTIGIYPRPPKPDQVDQVLGALKANPGVLKEVVQAIRRGTIKVAEPWNSNGLRTILHSDKVAAIVAPNLGDHRYHWKAYPALKSGVMYEGASSLDTVARKKADTVLQFNGWVLL